MRCEGPCPSRAYATVTKIREGSLATLTLCGHHVRISHEKLTAEGWTIRLEEGAEKQAWLPESLLRKVSNAEDLTTSQALQV